MQQTFVCARTFEHEESTHTYGLSQGFVGGEEIVFILFLPHFTGFSENIIL